MSAIEEKEYKHIKIQRDVGSPNLTAFLVLSKNGKLLGQIRWWKRENQYRLYPYKNTALGKGHLDDISSFIDGLMKEEERMPEVPPLTLEDLGIPTPETNREHIKRLSTQIESIIDGMANLRMQSPT